MLLRASIERVLPVRRNEVRLTAPECRGLFRGRYALTKEITGITEALAASTDQLGTYRDLPSIIVSRRRDFTDTEVPSIQYSDLRKPSAVPTDQKAEKLRRASRVEKVAQYAKFIGGTAVAFGLTAGIWLGSAGSEQAPAVRPCAEIIDGTQTLVPALSAIAAPSSEQLCDLGTHQYQVLSAAPHP